MIGTEEEEFAQERIPWRWIYIENLNQIICVIIVRVFPIPVEKIRVNDNTMHGGAGHCWLN